MKILPILGFAALCLFSLPAMAADAFPTRTLNLRAGPDGGYPLVATLNRNEPLNLLGCVSGLQWCEVETRYHEHGWVYAQYLHINYGGRVITVLESSRYGGPGIVIFDGRPYWDRYYTGKPFYSQRTRWIPAYNRHDNDHNWNNDDDHGHHGDSNNNDGHGNNSGRSQQAPSSNVSKKYDPLKPMKMPGNGKYNPLCPMGQSHC